MHRAAATLTFVAVASLAAPSQADIAPRPCSAIVTWVDCTAAQLDEVCPSGGVCKRLRCDMGSVLKCDPCEATVVDPTSTCKGSGDVAKACGDGGVCTATPAECLGGAGAVCGDGKSGPTPATSSSDTGCSLGPAGSQAACAGLMIAIGTAALLFDRRRSRRP